MSGVGVVEAVEVGLVPEAASADGDWRRELAATGQLRWLGQ